MNVTFFGAAGEVTGSKHLVEIAGKKILLDCGAYQGHREEARERNKQLGFAAAEIDAVIISHAHFDHVGLLPVLVKQGFRGKIFATGATRDLAELILLDAAHIQEQDAMYLRKHGIQDPDAGEPLYTQDDIPAVMQHFVHLPYNTDHHAWTTVAEGVEAKLYDAGHILGSAVTVIRGQEHGQARQLAYTGDLGRPGRPLLRDPQPIQEAADILLMEATYGTRLHHPEHEVEGALIASIQRAVKLHGRVIVPAFSMGRTQQLIYILHRMTDEGKIPRIPIIIDSPLASRITKVFAKHQNDYDKESRQDFSRPNENPLDFTNLEFTQSVDESKAILKRPGPWMVISASGMLSGGRVLHHLKNFVSDPTTTVMFTGYQAIHTMGRHMVQGAKHIRIYGRRYPVRAKLDILNDLSAHADANELMAYAEKIPGLHLVALTHSEPDRAAALATLLRQRHPQWSIIEPTIGQTLRLP